MRRYCLSYDVKNSKDWREVGADQLKLGIAEILIDAGATNLQSPVASTIYFDDAQDGNRLNMWNGIISTEYGEDIHYYLCLLSFITATGTPTDKISGDLALMNRFREQINNR